MAQLVLGVAVVFFLLGVALGVAFTWWRLR